MGLLTGLGSSKNIVAEIKTVITRMLSLREKKRWYGYFNKDMYLFEADYGLDVACQKYKDMYERFDEFRFILIDHDKYLLGCNFDDKDYKIKYAEIKYAKYSKALYCTHGAKNIKF